MKTYEINYVIIGEKGVHKATITATSAEVAKGNFFLTHKYKVRITRQPMLISQTF